MANIGVGTRLPKVAVLSLCELDLRGATKHPSADEIDLAIIVGISGGVLGHVGGRFKEDRVERGGDSVLLLEFDTLLGRR
jgi:hypothetical protein